MFYKSKLGSSSWRHEKLSRIVWIATAGAAKIVHTHRTSRRSSWPRGFGARNSGPHSWIFASVSVGSSPWYHVFTCATGSWNRCSHCTKVWQKSYPISEAPRSRVVCYTTVLTGRSVKWQHKERLRNRLLSRSARCSLFRHRNPPATTVLVCEQEPYTFWFSWGRKDIHYSVNIASVVVNYLEHKVLFRATFKWTPVTFNKKHLACEISRPSRRNNNLPS